jgi:predicted dehydrogenase
MARGVRRYNNDNLVVTITFADGSVGTIHYLANGSTAVEKEYLEIFGDQKTARMWNFKKLEPATARNDQPALSQATRDMPPK